MSVLFFGGKKMVNLFWFFSVVFGLFSGWCAWSTANEDIHKADLCSGTIKASVFIPSALWVTFVGVAAQIAAVIVTAYCLEGNILTLETFPHQPILVLRIKQAFIGWFVVPFVVYFVRLSKLKEKSA